MHPASLPTLLPVDSSRSVFSSQLPVTNSDRSPAGEGEVAPVTAVILYETASAARRALAMVSRLGSLAGDDFQFRPILWRFDLLAYENWRHAAFHATVADVVILATDNTQDLPPAISHWVEEIVATKAARPAVLALFGSETQ